MSQNNNQNMNVPEGSLLEMANNILNMLEYSSQLDREEDLFLDDFYIAIVSNLVSERKFDISPGNTLEEKEESLKKLLEFLSQIIDLNLESISPHGIIFEHDRVSTQYLLSLLEELIKALIEQQGHEEEQEEEEMGDSSQKLKESDIAIDTDKSKPHNISDDKILQKRKNNLFDENEQDEGNEIEQAKAKKKEIDNEIEVDKISDINEAQNDNLKENDNENDQDKENLNVNNISPPIDPIDNLDESMSNKKNKDSDLNTNSKRIKSLDNQDEQNQSQDIDDSEQMYLQNRSCLENHDFNKYLEQSNPSDTSSYIRKTLTENDLLYLQREEEEEIMEQMNMRNEEEINYDGQNEKERVTNVSHISEVSKSKENSEQQKQLYAKKRGEASDLTDKHAQSKYSDIKKDDLKDVSQTSILLNENKYKYNSDKNDINDISNLDGYEDDDYKDIIDNSYHSVPQAQRKMKLTSSSISNISNQPQPQKKVEGSNNKINDTSSSKKKLSNKPSNKPSSKKIVDNNNNNNKLNQSNISKNSHNQSHASKQKSTLNSYSYGDIEMTDEEAKDKIVKEFKRLYGNKLDNIFLKYNMKNSKDIVELILRNIKLARERTMKIANRIPDPDDLETKEFIQRHQKEFQYFLKYYQDEEKKRNAFQERGLRMVTQNGLVNKKIQEIQTRKIESEIERKRKAREVKKRENQLRMCNEIYSKALKLEKEKHLEEISNQMEHRKSENEEKRNAMKEIEKFYMDKISILREVLKREKAEREIEHRAKIQFLSKLERERKSQFRKEINRVFDRFDEEDKRADFENNNQEEIEKILANYYRK